VWNEVPAPAVQAVLRQAFGRWGRPARLRLDNGWPWGGWNDLPTALALWLVGLGIELTFNPPCQPQHNGVVEKAQDTGQRWCPPADCAGVAALQEQLDAMDQLQRDEYPYVEGHSRSAIFPGLCHSGRSYTPAWEEQAWDLSRAEAYLSASVAVRQVGKKGQVSIYAWRYSVGSRNQGQTICVQYVPEEKGWLMTDHEGKTLRLVPAPEITRERIRALDISPK